MRVVGLSVFKLVCVLACQCSHCPTGVRVIGLPVHTVLLVCVCWPVGVHTALLVCECVVGLLMFTLSYWCSPVSVHTVLLVCVFVVVGLSVFTLSYWCVNVLLACQCSHTVLLMCMCWHCPSGVWVCWPVGVHTALLVCECVVGLLVFTLSYWCVCCVHLSYWCECVVGLSVFTLSYWCVNVLLACQCSHTVLLVCVLACQYSHTVLLMCVLACQCSHCPTGVWVCWPVSVGVCCSSPTLCLVQLEYKKPISPITQTFL